MYIFIHKSAEIDVEAQTGHWPVFLFFLLLLSKPYAAIIL